jgi:hypothetical protein
MQSYLPGDGELASLIRSYDWSATALGSLEAWPTSLRTLVGVMLGGNQPTHIVWGPEKILLYNDGFAKILGRKHPNALGRCRGSVYDQRSAVSGAVCIRRSARKRVHEHAGKVDLQKLGLCRRGCHHAKS